MPEKSPPDSDPYVITGHFDTWPRSLNDDSGVFSLPVDGKFGKNVYGAWTARMTYRMPSRALSLWQEAQSHMAGPFTCCLWEWTTVLCPYPFSSLIDYIILGSEYLGIPQTRELCKHYVYGLVSQREHDLISPAVYAVLRSQSWYFLFPIIKRKEKKRIFVYHYSEV